jgi:hypothetical protein
MVKWPVQGGPLQLSGAHELEDYGKVVLEGVKKVGGGKSRWEGVVYVQAECVSVSQFFWVVEPDSLSAYTA